MSPSPIASDARAGRQPPLKRALAELADLSPAYFGMVMATGIVSLAAHLLALPGLARALFQLNIVVYAVLWLLTVLRAACHPRRFFSDMVNHLRGPGFFTTVAATSVLGSQFVVLAGDYRTGAVLWVVAIVLWIGLTYTIFAGFTIKENKPTLDQGISGAWLLAVVATQSIAVLSALLAVGIGQPIKLEMNFLALSMWLWGGMLYIWMMSLIFYRYTFFPFSPGDLSPPYWINMGAMAISTLAGSLLIINARRRTVPAVAAAVHQGLHGLLLGDRYLVDTDAGGSRGVAPRVSALPDQVRPALLGGGVSSGHVCGQHPGNDRSDGISVPRFPAAGISVHRACGLGSDVLRACLRPAAPRPLASSLGVAVLRQRGTTLPHPDRLRRKAVPAQSAKRRKIPPKVAR